jgi:hypothetical protein
VQTVDEVPNSRQQPAVSEPIQMILLRETQISGEPLFFGKHALGGEICQSLDYLRWQYCMKVERSIELNVPKY